jgi:hypothetical protein
MVIFLESFSTGLDMRGKAKHPFTPPKEEAKLKMALSTWPSEGSSADIFGPICSAPITLAHMRVWGRDRVEGNGMLNQPTLLKCFGSL